MTYQEYTTAKTNLYYKFINDNMSPSDYYIEHDKLYKAYMASPL